MPWTSFIALVFPGHSSWDNLSRDNNLSGSNSVFPWQEYGLQGGARSMSRKGTIPETRVHWQLRNLGDRQANGQHQGSSFQHCSGKALPVGRNKK